MSLTRYIIRRMLLQVFVLVGVSSLTFFMMIIMPGDPATILLETTGSISSDAVEKFRERWGFDQPPYMQYLTFMGNLVRGDFGESFVTRKEISSELASFLPATAELSVVAFLMAVIMAIPAGILAAVKRNGLPDHIVRVVSLFGTSMPIFWFAIILLLVFFLLPGMGAVLAANRDNVGDSAPCNGVLHDRHAHRRGCKRVLLGAASSRAARVRAGVLGSRAAGQGNAHEYA